MGKKMIDRTPRRMLLKKMITMHDGGMTYAEIGKELGLTGGYVGQSIRSARRYHTRWLNEPDELEELQVMTRNCLRAQWINTKDELLAAIRNGDVYAENKWTGFGQKCVDDVQVFARNHFGEEVASALDVKKNPTPKEAALKIRELPREGAPERFRGECLLFMCGLLRGLGYGETVDFFEKESS